MTKPSDERVCAAKIEQAEKGALASDIFKYHSLHFLLAKKIL